MSFFLIVEGANLQLTPLGGVSSESEASQTPYGSRRWLAEVSAIREYVEPSMS